MLINKFTNLDTIDDLNERQCAKQMLDTAEYYTHLLEGDMTFQEFSDTMEEVSYNIHNMILDGDIDEDNYIGYIPEFILEDNFGVDVTTSYPDGYFRGAIVMVAVGGPNVWIDTNDGYIKGSWGNLTMKIPFVDGIGMDNYIEETMVKRW